MNQTSRQTRGRHGTAIRTAVVLLALYAVLPAHLVLCSEDGQSPQLEPAINGQCLAGIVRSCCPQPNEGRETAAASAAALVKADRSCADDHCIRCVDEMLFNHSRAGATSATTPPLRHAAGGCLFNLASLPAGQIGASVLPGAGVSGCGAPQLAMLLTTVSRLLI